MKNIFIEGMQGSGKTTLLTSLYKKLQGYHMYLEGDISPVELSWCSYMTEEEYQHTLSKYPDLAPEIKQHTAKENNHFIVEYTRIITDITGFHRYMEQYEIYNGRRSFQEFKDLIFSRFANLQSTGNLFECSFFQNVIEELMLFYCMSEEEILGFYTELFEIVRQKDFLLLYICSNDIEDDILKIKRERCDENGAEIWYPLMMRYLNASPYGRKNGFTDISDMTEHFRKRMALELKIIEEILEGYAVILSAKSYDLDEIAVE